MHQEYIIAHPWSIIENKFDTHFVRSSESIFSIGNGYMGQRANFEEDYSGKTLQGSYIGGIYYPDKTRVGWWKNGYPEYFAKVLNAPNWIGISIKINGETLDLHQSKLTDFYRELNMKEGWLKRSFTATLQNGNRVQVESIRFISLKIKEAGIIQYKIKALNFKGIVEITPYLDGGIKNHDANYDEYFWNVLGVGNDGETGFVCTETYKTEFRVCTTMQNLFYLNNKLQNPDKKVITETKKIAFQYSFDLNEQDVLVLQKFVVVTQSMNFDKSDLFTPAKKLLETSVNEGFESLLTAQKQIWEKIWQTSDIVIEGDVKAQQAIRFNIFQLNQTYTGDDARLNIGPKGFTGEKYGGSTYWDTEAYCIPFYMSTKDKEVARNLLQYRYNQLDKAIENGVKLGFTNGAALYPMVTMNGEECHNEWEITFEEIHRNGAMLYAIYNYVNYTGDYQYIPQYGMEVMIAVSRFWVQRANFSQDKNQFVILGVTGPNEYENNVNNNFYTNYLAQWCIKFTLENIKYLETEYNQHYQQIISKTKLQNTELDHWKNVADNMYFPKSDKLGIYLQQDGFLDKQIVPVTELPTNQRPINQKWSWDRILRSCYIKQADVLQGMYFFENQFDVKDLEKHFDFYEPITVHESSLSPCVHSIIASKLNRIDKAYELYLRTARLDLDDYNHEVDEGLHITSMAGTWLSVVQGFGGMRNFNNQLSFNPVIPKQWQSYAFKINYRERTLQIFKNHQETIVKRLSGEPLEINVNGEWKKI